MGKVGSSTRWAQTHISGALNLEEDFLAEFSLVTDEAEVAIEKVFRA